jgi:long-chain acyl-CoA synthetase
VTADTIPARLFGWAERTPGRPAYYEKVDGEFRATSWAEYAAQVKGAAKALIALGMEPGGHAAILGFNRPEWTILDLACMAAGGAPVGIYTTNSADEVQYIVDHSESLIVLVENRQQLDKVLSRRGDMPSVQRIVTMRGVPSGDEPGVISWQEFLNLGDSVGDDTFAARLDALEPHGLATLIYTSGTTGPPKGVMLTHHNLAWTSQKAGELVTLSSDERLISYLPLSHIAEQMFTLHGSMTFGYAVWFAESIEKLADNLEEVRPTIFFAVPRVWERFHTGVATRLAEAHGAKAKIVAWAQRVGKQVTDIEGRGRRPGPLLAVQYALASRLVFGKLHAALGLDACRFAISGAAPLSEEVIEFFCSLDLPIYEVYGQSEGSGPTTFNQIGRARFGSVGPPYPGVEVRIAEDGEVLARGGNVFAGYYRDEETTARTLIDGWLYSGDLGEFDAEGFLHITGRKKDIIITAGGKNIAPKNLEAGLKDSLLVSEAVVIGDRRKYLTMLVTLDPETAGAFAAEHGVTGPLHEAPEVIAAIQDVVDEVNARLARVEQIKRFTILPRELTIEDGELTGTLKVKRDVVLHHFADAIEAMYVD